MPARRVVNGLRVFWVILVLWCELGIFPYQVSQCSWPVPGRDGLDTVRTAQSRGS